MNFLKILFGGEKAPLGYDNVSSTKFESLIKETKDAILIDVRTSGEFSSGHIPNALNYDVMSGAFQKKLASFDKNKTFLVYCRSGNRSGQAAKILATNGFTKIYNLSGGVGAWSGKLVR
jgi:rhodanese-related sulfurtransferase